MTTGFATNGGHLEKKAARTLSGVPADYADRWWFRAPDESPHEAVVKTVRWLRDRQDYRRRADLLHAQLYNDQPMVGFGLRAFSRINPSDRVSINVIQNACDALQAKICKVKPKPTFLVSGGDYSLKRDAEMLDKFCEGQLYESDYYETAPSVALDACIYGTGVVKIYEADERIRVERTYPWELLVSDAEARYGKPRSLYQRKYVDRAVLAEMYPEHADEILAARNSDTDTLEDVVDYDEQSDQILVMEAWHLPSSKKAKDGRHIICISTCTLFDEQWKRDHFPFAFLRRNKPQFGFWGIGVAQQLFSIHTELQYLSRSIQEVHHLGAKMRVFVEANSKVNAQAFTNQHGIFVQYVGTPPTIHPGASVPGDVYSYQQFLIQTAYEIAGISRLSAQSQKPAGLDSAIALRTYDDIQSERFVTFQNEFEDLVLEVAKQMIELARERGSDGYEVRVADKSKTIHLVDIKDIDLREEEYVMKVFPTSVLPSTPAGKLQWVQDISKTGAMPPEDVLDLLDIPDTESFQKRRNAARRVIERNIESMIGGEYVSPEPVDNHALAIQMVRDAYHNARLDGVPEENCQLLLQYIDASIAEKKKVETQAAPPPPMPPANANGAPPGPPGPPPPNMPPPAAPPGGMLQ